MNRQPAPDYTNAFLVSFGSVVFMALCVIWAVWGLIAALAIGWGADRLLARRARQRP